MTLITSSIPNLVNGVSQQPSKLRLSSQGQAQVNCLSSVAEGLLKRPPSEYLGTFTGVTEDAFFHTINRDSTERYQVAIEAGDLKVYNLDGAEKIVAFPNGKAYLASASPKDVFQCLTVADYTFILNKEVTVASKPDVTVSRPNEALVWVRQGAYGATYSVKIDGVEQASYSVPDGSTAAHSTSVNTTNIATQLTTQLTANLGGDFTVSRLGSTVYITNSVSDFTLRCDSTNGDSYMSGIKETVQRFSDLPARAVEGFVIEIAGDNDSAFDNYYVEYKGASAGEGTWLETVKEGEEFKLEGSTMPHGLVREADGSFTFKELGWEDRRVGDLESTPFPSYVGRTIADVFFFRNRLGFASDENFILSKAGSFFDFFRGTATSILDDDPIDVGSNHVKVSLLKQVVPFNESLLLFSDQTQFQTGAVTTLTPESVSINPTTEYECSLKAKPVGVGKFVYFATTHGKYSGIREYYVDKDTESEQASEITAHVPKYILGEIRQIASSSSENFLAILADGDTSVMYIYKYYFGGDDKLQASWSKWTLGGEATILSMTFIESLLYVMVSRDDGVHMEVINLSAEVFEEDWSVRVHLDSKVSEAETTVVLSDTVMTPSATYAYEVTLPYKLSDTEDVQLITSVGGSHVQGSVLIPFQRDNSGATTKLYFTKNLIGQPFLVGRPYSARYRLSDLMLRETTGGGGQVAINQGRLQLRKLTARLSQTGYMRAEVTPSNRETYKYVFTGVVAGAGFSLLGSVTIRDGILSVPILAKNDSVTIDFINDTYLPSSLLSIDWEALYAMRAKRV